MTDPDAPTDNTTSQGGAAPGSADAAERGVRGGSADRMDAEPGGPARGADGDTAAREHLRKDLGERTPDADEESPDALGSVDLGATGDPADTAT